MKPLLELIEWVSLADAAKYVSAALDDDVQDFNLVRLGIAGALSLSVHLVNQAVAKVGVLPDGEFQVDDFGQLSIMSASPEPQTISGVWHLIAVGSGEIELERLYQRLTNGPDVELWSAGGIYLARPDRSVWAELSTPAMSSLPGQPERYGIDYRPAHALPSDAVVVVRVEDLQHLLSAAKNADETYAHPPVKAIPAQRAQEESILAKLLELGYAPLALPAPLPGKHSVAKRATRDALRSYSDEVFFKAWKRLQQDERIKYA